MGWCRSNTLVSCGSSKIVCSGSDWRRPEQLTYDLPQLTWVVSRLTAALPELLQLSLLVHLLLLQVLVPVGHLGSKVRHLVAGIHLDGHLHGRQTAVWKSAPFQTRAAWECVCRVRGQVPTLSGSPAGWQTILSGSDCLSLRAFRWLLIPVPSICH